MARLLGCGTQGRRNAEIRNEHGQAGRPWPTGWLSGEGLRRPSPFPLKTYEQRSQRGEQGACFGDVVGSLAFETGATVRCPAAVGTEAGLRTLAGHRAAAGLAAAWLCVPCVRFLSGCREFVYRRARLLRFKTQGRRDE